MNLGIGLDNSQLRSDASESQNILRSITRTAEQEGASIDAAFRKVGTAIAGAFTAQKVVEFGRSMVEVRKEIESFEISFRTLLGSKEKADQLFGEIRKFAADTPMTLKDLASGAQTLLGFNYEADKVMTTLKALGDISMGDSQRFQSLTLAFAQMSSTGKLMGQDLLQMINAGFNPLSVISEKTGKSIGELKDEMSKGAISSQEVEDAFLAAASAGGKFNGMLDAQSHSMAGAKAQLEGAVDDMFNALGESAEGVYTGVVNTLADMARHYKEIGEAIAVLVGIYGTYKAALIATNVIESASNAIKYTEEAAALEQLLTVEQREQISKLNLSKNSAEYAAVVKKEALANVEAARSAATKANANMQASLKSAAAAKSEYLYAVKLQAQAEKNLATAIASGDAKAIETAKREVATAATIREEAATKMLSTQKSVETARTAAASTAETAAAAAKTAETAAAGADATAHGILTMAKNAATAAAAKLNAVIMANPYAIALAAAVALAYGIYKLASYETDAEKASKALHQATEDCQAAIASETAQIDILFGTLKGATKGTKEYEDAKRAILDQYGDYLKGLSDEVSSLRDVEAAYIAVKKAAEEAAKARAMDAYKKQASEEYGKKYGEQAIKIRDALLEKYGNKKGAEYYIKLKPVIEGKQTVNQLSKEMQGVVNSFNKTNFVSQGMFAPAIAYTTNAITDGINKVTQARKVFNDTVDEATAIFGNQGLESEDKKEESPVVKNKKYWEDQVKELQGQLDAMSDAELKTQKAADLRKKITAAQKKVDTYSTSKVNTAATKAETAAQRQQKKDNQQKVQQAQLTEQQGQMNQQQVVAAREFALTVRQAEIDGMQEGFDKELAQNEQNYKKLLEENIKRKEQFVEQLRDMAEVQWEMKNPNAKDKGQTFDRNSVSADILEESYDISKLPDDQQAIINQMRAQLSEYARFASESYERANKQSLNNMLGEVMTYEQQREKITKDYAEKREQMYDHEIKEGEKIAPSNRTGLKKGVSQENVGELDRQEQEALKAVDENFASRQEEYKAWCDAIGELTLQQLEALLAKAKQELDTLEQNGGNSQQLSTARAKVNKLDMTVKSQKAANVVSPKKKTIKEWEDLYSTLNDCADSFEEIGDAVGGTTGDILKAAGQIATSTLSMINGIVTLSNSSGTAMQGTAKAAAASMSTVEKASVILTVISAALQVATAIASLFNDDEAKQEEIEHLQDRIDQLQWELDNADTVRLEKEYGSAAERTREAIAATRLELVKAAAATEDWIGVWKALRGQISKNQAALEKTASAMADAYEKMSYTADKALGDERYSSYREQLENISEQQILIQEQIDKEKSKKDSDSGQIEEWEQKLEELAQQAVDVINDMMEDIIGGSATDIAEELSDAFFDAFENGEDAAEAWGDKVKEITADIVKKMLVQKMLEPEIGKIFDKYKSKWFKDGKFVGQEEVANSMDGFMSDLQDTESIMEQIWGAIPEDLKQYLSGGSYQQDGSSGGYETMSQDTGEELNGRFTAVQESNEIIKEQTLKIGVSIEEMRTISLNSMGFLEDIAKNTHELYEMNERMGTIAKKIENL